MAEERLSAARIAALFNVARPAYYATLANGVLLVVVLWEAFPPALLLAWLGVLVAVTAARIEYHRRFSASAAQGRVGDPARWEQRFAAGALVAGALWAYPPAVFLPASDPLLQMAIIFVVGGSIIGAAGVYAPSPRTFYAFSVLPLVAVVAQLALQPGRTYTLLAVMIGVFAVVMLRVFQDIHGSIVRTLGTQHANDRLVGRLAQSEAQLRDAIESFPEGIAVYDPEDKLVVCNEVYARVYGAGRSPAQLVGVSYPEIALNAFQAEALPPNFGDEQRTLWLEDRLRRRRSGAGEVRHYETRDGRTLQGLFVRSRGGGIVSMFTDVTELKRVQAAYGQVLAEESVVLDTLPVGVAFLAERVIVRCNRRLEEMLGYAPGELNGQSSRVLYPSDEHWREAGERYKLMSTSDVLEGEFRLNRKDGTTLRCHAFGRPLSPEAPQASMILAYSDISERHAAERALRKSEAMYRSLVETSNDLIWSMDGEGRWTYLNPGAVERIYGCPAAELLGRSFRDVLAREVRERDVAVFSRILAGEPLFDFETRHLRRDGSVVDLSFNALALRDTGGRVIGATGTARDVSALKRSAAALHESVEKLRLAVDAAELEYWEWDRASDSLHFGTAPGSQQTDERRIAFDSWLLRVHEDDRERCRDAAIATQQRAEPYTVDFRIHDRAGKVRWMHSRGKAIADPRGEVVRVIGVSQDITDRKRQEEEARFLAYHDTLTGLPNRRLLDDRLRQAVFMAQRRDARIAVMVMDLDHFKQVNDVLGHRAGDAVLREAAHRIAGCVRKADTLARQGGDEFVVVIPELQLDGDCQVVAEKILRALAPAFRVDGRDFNIGASIGISLFPGDAGDGEALLRNADVAMYRAKQLGRNNYRFYGR